MKYFFGGSLLGDIPETLGLREPGRFLRQQARWLPCLSITSRLQRQYILLKAFF